MHRIVALTLLFAVPAFAQQQTSLVPAYEQSNEQVPLKVEAETVNWKPWVIAGGAALVIAVVVSIVAVAATSHTPLLEKKDFGCTNNATGCDAYINAPPR